MKKPNKILAVCTANAFRSPFIEASTRGYLIENCIEGINVSGRGIKADYWRGVVQGKQTLEEKYLKEAFQRAVSFPQLYSENVRYAIEQGQDPTIVARLVFGEERKMSKDYIARSCEEMNLPFPSGFYQQLGVSDIGSQGLTHIIVATEAERDGVMKVSAQLKLSDITVLGIKEQLGSTYKDKSQTMFQIKERVYAELPSILG